MKKKKIFGAKQVVMAALLAALGGAVWLNMQYSTTAGGFVQSTSSNKNLGDTKYVATVSEGSTVETAASTDYFKTAAADRKNAREEALALLEDTLKNIVKHSDTPLFRRGRAADWRPESSSAASPRNRSGRRFRTWKSWSYRCGSR